MWEAERKSAFPLPKQKTIQNRRALYHSRQEDPNGCYSRGLEKPGALTAKDLSHSPLHRVTESMKLGPTALHTSSRQARETNEAGIYRMVARGLKCWLGPPARPKGLSG